MVVADVGGIANDEIEAWRRTLAREIGLPDIEIALCPQLRRGLLVIGIDFKAKRLLDPIVWENLPQRRIECAGSDGGIKKGYRLVFRQ